MGRLPRLLVLVLFASTLDRSAPAVELVPLPPAPADVPWPTARWPIDPSATDVDWARLEIALLAPFADLDPRAPQGTRALLVVHRGRLVAERYATGIHRETRLPGWSMTKSLLNALCGILVGEGSLDLAAPAPVPAWSAADDPRHAITPDQLLRMSSGLEWREVYFDFTSPVTQMLFGRHRSDMAAWAGSVPAAHPPDTVWLDSSGSSLVLSGVVRRLIEAGGRDSLAFARQALFARIGMRSAVIEPDAAGTLVGSSFSYATARDWARFGYLYLRDGVWDGERILPAGWVDYTRTPTPAAPQGEYGAHFWLNAGVPQAGVAPPMPALPGDLFYASGFEGQFVVIVPSRDLVLVRLGLTQVGEADLEGLLSGIVAAFPVVEMPPRAGSGGAAPSD